MTAPFRVCRVSLCVAALAAQAGIAGAQDPPPIRAGDTAWLRMMGCGTHASTVQRRVGTAEVRQALSKVASCPEAPDIISRLWADGPGVDSAFLRSLASVTSLGRRPVADALLQTVSDRTRPAIARVHALGVILSQLKSEYGFMVDLATGPRTIVTYPDERRPADPTDDADVRMVAAGVHRRLIPERDQ